MKPRAILYLVVASLAALGAGGSAWLRAGQAQSTQNKYVVIVNSADSSGAGTTRIRKLFLKQVTEWSGGRRARPYDRKPNHPAHRAFVTSVLGMTESGLATHWLSVKQVTGATPPRAVSSDRALIKLVAKHPGAFGFLSADKAKSLPRTVRVLLEF